MSTTLVDPALTFVAVPSRLACEYCRVVREGVMFRFTAKYHAFLCSRCLLDTIGLATGMRFSAQYDYAMNARKTGDEIRATKPPRRRRTAAEAKVAVPAEPAPRAGRRQAATNRGGTK